MHEEGVVDRVVALLRLVLAAHLIKVRHVPAERHEDRFDQGVLGVLLTDRLAVELGDALAHRPERGRKVTHAGSPLPIVRLDHQRRAHHRRVHIAARRS